MWLSIYIVALFWPVRRVLPIEEMLEFSRNFA